MRYSPTELHTLLLDELNSIPGNMTVYYRPRANITLFEDLVAAQMEEWLQEIGTSLYDYIGIEVSLAYDSETATVLPEAWINKEGAFIPEDLIFTGDLLTQYPQVCYKLNTLTFDVAQMINLHCAAINEQMSSWWTNTQNQIAKEQ